MSKNQPSIEEKNSSAPAESLDHVMRARMNKLDRLAELGVDPYPHNFSKDHTVEEVIADFDALAESGESRRIAGRLMSIRLMGKVAFAHLLEENHRIQLYFKKDQISPDSWKVFRLLDIGDIIGVEGTLFVTRTGEKTLNVNSFKLLSKNVRPLPAIKEKGDETWFKWTDKEERYRNRTVDLLINQESRDRLIMRSRIVREIRNFLDADNFLEVETPILQAVYGGAAAKPFVTFYNALDSDFYLRIADELYLKRLIAGGIPRVYEIGKDFRNEGIDRLHSPEFTMLECYCAWEDYNFCADLMERLISHISETILKKSTIEFDRMEVDITPPYSRVYMPEIVKDICGIDIVGRDRNELAAEISDCSIEVEDGWGVGKLIDELVSNLVEPTLIEPTFLMDYPVELSPLAKRHRSKKGLVERFELFIAGHEVANSFTELNDPIEQRRRFEEQAKLFAAGDEEAHPVDEDFLQALETGMPPTAGLGVGIDRLIMLLTGASSLRDTILFPTLRLRH